MRKTLVTAVANGILGAVILALLLAYGGREVSLRGTVQSTPEQRQARVVAATEAVVAEQVAALGCDTVPRLSERVAVTPFPVKGEHVFDTAVVSLVPFDVAWEQAQAGRVVVQGWCS
jgi:hypothetical protein